MYGDFSVWRYVQQTDTDGICIFATNFAEKYDKAFERRLTMHVDFNLPTKKNAMLILKKILPKKSLHQNFSFDKIDISGLSGGDIKNVALNAAGLAAKEDMAKINTKHIKNAVGLVKTGQILQENNQTNYMG